GLQVQQKSNGIFISQDKYVVDILKKFDFSTIKTASILMEPNKALIKDAEAKDVSSYSKDFTSSQLVFWYPRDSPIDLEAYSDSDYAGASLDKKSTIGEYVVAASCYGQVLWIQNQMLDYGFNLMNTKIYIENKSTICIVKNPVFHSKTKHIEIRHHFIRDSYEKNLIQVTKISQSSGPTNLVVDETVYKEWEDIMERAATTACSLEVEHDSGSGPRCQVTILGGAESQTRFEATSKQFNDPPLSRSSKPIIMLTPTFAEIHNLVAFLEKPSESEGFKQIIDFLNAKPIRYALTVNPTVYASCVKQFWTTAKEDASKQGRSIKDIYQDAKIALVDEAQGRMHDAYMFRVDDLEGNEVIVDVREKTVEKEVSTTDLVTTAGEVVTAASVEDSVAPTTATIIDVNEELTFAKTLIEIKAAKPKVILTAITTPRAKGIVVYEQVQAHIPTISSSKDKVKAKPLKKKDKISLDEEVARTLEAEMRAKIEEEERIAREKDEANRDVIKEWDDVQATINADRQLAKKIQAQEREQLSIEERSKLLAELIESRRKYFTAKRAKEIRNKPPTKVHQKILMCTYMKNMEGFKQKDLKVKSFDDIKKIFNKVYKRVNTFVDMDTENVKKSLKKTQAEGSSKRARQELEQESAKKQKLVEQEQAKVADDDTAELKRCLEIVPEDDDDDVVIKATPISSKSFTIVDYKIYRERKKSHFKIIKADVNSQNYLTFRTMFKNFNREDLEVLRIIVKERFKKTKPVDDMKNLLFQTLKTMFEPHVEDIIWKYQQGAVKVNNWKLFDSCRVYCVTTKTMVYYLMVEKMYPFKNNVLHQLWSYLVLLVYKVTDVFNKVNAAMSRVTTAVRFSTAGWIKWLEDQDMQVNEIY
nr:hypothetical protein [Tanacetum cinerariifolium]